MIHISDKTDTYLNINITILCDLIPFKLVVPKRFWANASLVPLTHPQCLLPYPIKSILHNSGLQNRLGKMITIK
jgi:hypothetical protein